MICPRCYEDKPDKEFIKKYCKKCIKEMKTLYKKHSRKIIKQVKKILEVKDEIQI